MSYQGDITLEDTLDFKFTTRQISGAPHTLAGTPVLSCYEDNGTTEITAGITLTADFDSRTGLNHVQIAATAANGYEAGKAYDVVITTGTVNSVSVVGEVVGNFSIENRSINAVIGKLGDAAAAGDPTSADTLMQYAKQIVNVLAGTAGIATWPTAAAPGNAVNIAEAIREIYNDVTGLNGDAMRGTDSAYTGTPPTAAAISDAVWDELQSAHTTVGSFGELATEIASILEDTGTTIPDLIGAIGAGVGASLSVEATTDNVLGGISGVTSATTFVGVQTTNTFAVTAFDDATYHVIDDTGNAIDIVYQMKIGGGATPQSTTFNGYLSSSNDTMTVASWDHVGGAWEDISTIDGQNGTVDITKTMTLLSRHVGTSAAELGNVYIRFHCTGQSNPQFNVDQLLVNYAVTSQSVGYSGGYIYIDTNNGTAGTVDFTNGTADNPVDSIADALTLSTSLGINKFDVAANSAIVFAASFANKEMRGFNYTLDFGSQTIAGAYIKGANVQASTATGAAYILDECILDANVTMAEGVIRNSFFGNMTFTASDAGDYFWNGCKDRATGLASPIFDYGTAVGNTNLNVHDYSGALTVTNMGDTGTDTLVMSGHGRFIEGASNTGGAVTLIGPITESGVTNLTVTNQNFDRINTEADTALTDYGALTALPTIPTDWITADGLASDAVDEIRDGLLPTQNATFSNIPVYFVAASDHVTPVTGATGVTVEVSKDGGAFAAAAGTFAEISDGAYQFDATAADMNGGIIRFKFTATGGTPGAPDPVLITILTGGGV